jgi:PST family polysaccharide transporter
MRSGTAALISIIDRGVVLVALIVRLSILGRLLTPADFGVFSIILATQALFRPIIELGLGPAYVQRPTLEPYTGNVFFYVNTACGVLNSIVLISLAPLLSWYYEKPVLLGLMLFYSTSALIGSLGWQPRAHLMREKRFLSVMFANVLSQIAGVLVSIVMAYKGFAVWALCTGPVVSSVAASATLFMLGGQRYRIPSLRQIISTMDSIRFGIMVTLTRMINDLQISLDKLIIGKVFGDAALGGYAKSSQLAAMPETQLRNSLSTAALSYLCRLGPDPERKARVYKAFLLTLMLAPGALSLMLLFMGDYLIVFVMGPQWEFAGVYIRILGLLGTGLIIRGGLETIHYCENRMKSWARISLLGIAVGLLPPLICAISGLPVLIFAGVISGCVLVYWVAALVIVIVRLLSVRDLWQVFRGIGLIVIPVIAAGAGIRAIVEASTHTESLFSRLFVVSAGGIAAMLITQLMLNRKDLKLVWGYAKSGKT